MPRFSTRKLLSFIIVFTLVWLALRFLLPLALPFLLGGLIALAAEPLVSFTCRRLGWKRQLSAGVGITVTLVLLLSLLVLLGALAVKELGVLMGVLPNVEAMARQGLTALQDLLLHLAGYTPEGIRSTLTRMVLDLFSGGSALLTRLTQSLLGLLTAVAGWVPDGFLTLGTGILSAYMLSARLPRIRRWLSEAPATARLRRYLKGLKGLRQALFGWLKAQAKLSATTFFIVITGLLLLKIPYAPIWALLIALVDAVPMLGTGAVLLPWALITALQGQHMTALGLGLTFAAATLTRSALEPRLVGDQLGLDPLVTLTALYAGYRLWGIGGMLLAPMLAVTATRLASGGTDL